MIAGNGDWLVYDGRHTECYSDSFFHSIYEPHNPAQPTDHDWEAWKSSLPIRKNCNSDNEKDGV